MLETIGQSGRIKNTFIQGKAIHLMEMAEVIEPFFIAMEDTILESLEEVDDHVNCNAIKTNGIYYTGGGSKFQWIVERISKASQLKIKISSTPLLDISNGLIQAMNVPRKNLEWTTKS